MAALRAANAMVNAFRADDPDAWDACRRIAATVLGRRGASALHTVRRGTSQMCHTSDDRKSGREYTDGKLEEKGAV